LKDDYHIELGLNNKLQSDYLRENIKSDLERYLRDELRNKKIRLDLVVEDNGENGKKIYTSEEKFDCLRQKNPSLDKLKQEFNLDFE
jgi:DNA polymerase-3 subunit gamma/tau